MPFGDDSKHINMDRGNMLVMNWILISIEEIDSSLHYCKTTKELDSNTTGYTCNKNNARILQLAKEITQFKQGNLSLGDYYARLGGMW